MNYLEVKYNIDIENYTNDNNFISNIINSQKNLGLKKFSNDFEQNKLIDLGFTYNPSTNGYSLVKKFTFDEVKKLAIEIDKLNNHVLTHGYLILKIYNNDLYFWDTALIYEGFDTFEYCLKHHKLHELENIKFLTNSDCIKEEVLELTSFRKRYSQPTLEFISENCLWDKKTGYKIQRTFISDINDYIHENDVIEYIK